MISIVVTAYNVEEYIGKCIKSILELAYSDFELIIVEDCSTDNTLNIIKSFKDPRIKLLVNNINMGAGYSRKRGIEASSQEYVSLVDGDDYLDSNFYEELAKKAKESDADIVSTGMTIRYSNGAYKSETFGEIESEGMQKFLDYNDLKIIFLANKLIRRSLYDKVPYSTKRFCEDTPVIIPLLYYANKISYVNIPGYNYLQHDKSLCHRTNLNALDICKACCAKDMIKFFSDKEPEYRNLIPTSLFISYILNIKKRGYTKEDFKGFEEEYIEAMNYFLSLIKID